MHVENKIEYEPAVEVAGPSYESHSLIFNRQHSTLVSDKLRWLLICCAFAVVNRTSTVSYIIAWLSGCHVSVVLCPV
jgi:hypothetical protein